jgi:high-affinity nickel-transport protein
MAATITALFAVSFTLLCTAAARHYRLSKTDIFGVGKGILALTLGIRHAFDADHISAINNMTRKLMAEGKRPVSVGFESRLGTAIVKDLSGTESGQPTA